MPKTTPYPPRPEERQRINSLKSQGTLFGAILVSFIVGCSSSPQQPAELAELQSNSTQKLLAVTWQSYEDSQATDFAANCKTDYELGVRQFAVLENGHFATPALLDAINALDITVDRVVNRASLYHNVHPNPAMREAAGECEQKSMSLVAEISVSVPIYAKLKQVDETQLSPIDQRYLSKMMEAFELSGVNQPEAVRQRLTALNDEILKIGQQFSQNIREDVRTVYAQPEELAGLPADYIAAHPPGSDGLVAITTRYPDYLPVMQYAASDALRLRLYKAFRQRGYPANQAELKALLAKRYEYAQLLGFSSYAEYVTANKMIGSAASAQAFIDRINAVATPRAERDTQQLLARLKQINPAATAVGDWQKTYLENLLKNEVYQVDAQAVRQYFSYPQVKQGIFTLVEDLFDVRIEPWQTDVWHPTVETYQIVDGEKLVGRFYLDMHPREGKYSHAAAFGVQSGVAGVQPPIAALVCNFPGGEGGSALMEHGQVETFLHEFGHLIHGLFGGHQPRLSLSGITTEWDFVEAPSQMLEEWMWDAQTLQTFAKNAAGEVIPTSLIAKMNQAREFGKGIWTRQQMYYAALSLNYYNRPAEEVDLDRMMVELAADYAPFAHVDDTYFYAAFGHLDGYSAIYYTYMWSLVIAADMFSEFEKHGLRNTQVADRYRRTVLAAGSTKDAADLVEDFLGRPYNFEAFAKTLSQ